MFRHLHRAWGPQHWWPAETAFEMIVGAYLTQNTAWTNVELALARFRAANALSIDGVRRTPLAELEDLVRPAGYFRQKAARLKQFVAHLDAKYGAKYGAPLPPAVGGSGSVASGPSVLPHSYRAVAIEPALSEVEGVENQKFGPGAPLPPAVGGSGSVALDSSVLPHPYRDVCDRVGNSDSIDTKLSQHELDNRALDAMLSRPSDELRAELLALNGVGPETADSILLYAGLHPIFVVDAYTKRIFSRHALVAEDAKYEDIRALVETALGDVQVKDVAPPLSPVVGDRVGIREGNKTASSCAADVEQQFFRPPVHAPSTLSQLPRSETAQVFAEFHGLLVQVGKHFCMKQQPRCGECPLRDLLPNPLRSLDKP